jgi:integrase
VGAVGEEGSAGTQHPAHLCPWLLEDGADLRWVQQQMGHATIGQTADTYGHVAPERHEAAVARLDGYLTM